MSDIVHLSFGPRANYLNADFYNRQESYFVYTDEDAAASKIDPSVRFKAGKEYTPKALFWDLNGGFGSLEKVSEVYENKDLPQDVQIIDVGYTATKSWTDDLRVKLHPKTRLELANWHVDESSIDGKGKGSVDHRFHLYSEGREEYSHINSADGLEYADNVVRPLLESCDYLSGIAVTTDLNAWAGFADPILETVRDDFAPKTAIVTWALHENGRKPRAQSKSILEAVMGLNEWSDLLVPTAVDPAPIEDQALVQDYLYESFSLMSSLRKKRLSLQHLCDALTRGTECKIVQGGVTTQTATNDMFIPFKNVKYDYRPDFQRAKSPSLRNTVVIDRPKSLELATPDAEPLIKHVCPQPFDEFDSLRATLTLSSDPLELRKLVQPWDHELKERVDDFTDPYIWGYQSDSDFD